MRFLDGHTLEDLLCVPVKTAHQKLNAFRNGRDPEFCKSVDPYSEKPRKC